MREKCKGLWNNDEVTFNEDLDGTKKLKTILGRQGATLSAVLH